MISFYFVFMKKTFDSLNIIILSIESCKRHVASDALFRDTKSGMYLIPDISRINRDYQTLRFFPMKF